MTAQRSDRFHRIASGASAVVILLGSCGLIGWIFDIAVLKSVLPGLVTMKANTAASFVLAGVSLRFQIDSDASPPKIWIARACALLVLAVGLLTMAEYALGMDAGIDQILSSEPAGELQTSSPGRMAPITALNFALLGAVLLSLNGRRRAGHMASQALAIVVLLVAFVAFIGYCFDTAVLYGIPGYTSMAIHTAVGFAALSIGALSSRPQRGVIAILAQDNPAGDAIRRLLPIILAAPFIIGFLRLQGEQAGLYGPHFGLALMVTVCTGIFASVLLWHAHVQGVSETLRQEAVRDEKFLLELGELLRASTESSEATFQVSKRLGEYLGVSRCFFCEIDVPNHQATIHRDFASGLPSVAGTASLSYSAESIAEARAGRPIVSADVSADAQTASQYESAYRPAGIRARIAVPLLRNSEWVSMLVVSTHEKRVWQSREVALLQAVAERSWLWRDHLLALEGLRRADARKAAILNSAFDAIVSMDHRGVVVEFNPAAERLFGYKRSEALDKPLEDLLIPPSLRAAHRRGLARYLETGEGTALGKVLEFPAMRADGSEFPVELAITLVAGESTPFFTGFVRDVSDRKQSEQVMRQSEARFRLFVEAVKDYAIVLLKPDGTIESWNDGAERLKGYRAEEIAGENYAKFYLPEDVDAGKPQLNLETAARDGTCMVEGSRVRKDGSQFWANVWITAIRSTNGILLGFGKVTQDMTERRRGEQERAALLDQRGLNAGLEERVRERTAELTTALKEREVLLQEVHHRVKNNLQVISSLINMQARKLATGSGRDALEECQARVQTIALIHEKLYQSRNYAGVPFSEYARGLAANVFHATGISPTDISLDLAIEDLTLAVDKAIPCGLVLNELITNALKHAFPNGRPGTIRVELSLLEGGRLRLAVKDDGVGLPEGIDIQKAESLGLQLVCTLAEQLDAELVIKNQGGASFELTFSGEA